MSADHLEARVKNASVKPSTPPGEAELQVNGAGGTQPGRSGGSNTLTRTKMAATFHFLPLNEKQSPNILIRRRRHQDGRSEVEPPRQVPAHLLACPIKTFQPAFISSITNKKQADEEEKRGGAAQLAGR